MTKSKKLKVLSAICILVATTGFAYISNLNNEIADINSQLDSMSSSLNKTSDAYVRYELAKVLGGVYRVHRDVIAAGPIKENSLKAGEDAQDNFLRSERLGLISLAQGVSDEYSQTISREAEGVTYRTRERFNDLTREIGNKFNCRLEELRTSSVDLRSVQKNKIQFRDLCYTIFIVLQLFGLFFATWSEIVKPDELRTTKKRSH